MPKVNVYLNDELAEAVRLAGIPVSTVCQRALEDALRSTTALREGADKPASGLPAGVTLPGRPTDRLVHSIQLAFAAAADRKQRDVGTGHLLLGILDEGGNLGLKVLGALDIEEADIRTELVAALGDATQSGAPRLDKPAARATAAMAAEAIRMGHNYLGCEHLLLVIVDEPDGVGGKVLRSMGVDITVARRTVVTALTGFIHARANQPAPQPPTLERILAGLTERLDRIEARLEPTA